MEDKWKLVKQNCTANGNAGRSTANTNDRDTRKHEVGGSTAKQILTIGHGAQQSAQHWDNRQTDGTTWCGGRGRGYGNLFAKNRLVSGESYLILLRFGTVVVRNVLRMAVPTERVVVGGFGRCGGDRRLHGGHCNIETSIILLLLLLIVGWCIVFLLFFFHLSNSFLIYTIMRRFVRCVPKCADLDGNFMIPRLNKSSSKSVILIF